MNKAYVASLVLATLASAVAQAGERRQVVSRVFAVDKSHDVEVGAEERFSAVFTEEIAITDALADGHPFKTLSGTCVGWTERRGKAEKGNGECVYANSKGGKWQLTWDYDGSDGGNYRLRGYDGDASGWKGAGRWRLESSHPQGRSYQTWTGWIEAP